MNAENYERVNYLADYRERESACLEIIELLKEKSLSEDALWAPHLPQMVNALQFYQGLLRDEIEHFGEWRYHECDHDDLLDFIDEELDRLGCWLARMTNTSLLPESDN
jgi:tRNA isopentenyl-2-thiomethyl-A-37 hydroxylase MiaE